jgi:hypothetical protein
MCVLALVFYALNYKRVVTFNFIVCGNVRDDSGLKKRNYNTLSL